MRTLGSLVLATALLVGGASEALAAPGTCTVDSMAVAGEFPFPIPASGFVFDVDVDVDTGTFVFKRQAWLDEFGPGGLQFGTAGPDTALKMGASELVGTIDAAGNVVVPGFDSTFVVGSGASAAVLESTVTLSSGLTAAMLGGAPYMVSGQALDFATGTVTLTGIKLLPNPPLLGRATVSGLRVVCQLAPAPTAESLPPGLAVKRFGGKAKIDPSFEDGDEGDALTLKVKLSPGTHPPVLDGTSDVFVRIRQGGETRVLLGVVAQNQTVKGKKVVVEDEDGSRISVVEGRKATGTEAAVTGGKLVFRGAKKAITVSGKVYGLDLAALVGQTVDVEVAVGPQTARGTASVSTKGKIK